MGYTTQLHSIWATKDNPNADKQSNIEHRNSSEPRNNNNVSRYNINLNGT